MKNYLAISACVIALAGASCTTSEQQIYTGAGVGAAGGFLLSELLDTNAGWAIGLSLAGAAIGAEVARNSQTGECAYKRADGGVDIRPC